MKGVLDILVPAGRILRKVKALEKINGGWFAANLIFIM